MGQHRKLVQYLILAFVLLVGGYAISGSLFTSSAALAKGDKPPAFKLADLDNVAHDWSEYKGKPVILNFWGTFCPPCRAEMPALQKQYEKWHDQGLELVGINLSEDQITVERFAAEVGAKFPILLDRDKMTERAFGLKQYPTTFFISADGTIQDVVVGGPLDEDDLEPRIERIMNSRK